MLNHIIRHDFHYNGEDQKEEKINAAEAADARTATEEIRRRTNNSRGGLNVGFRKRMVEKSHSDDFITAMSEWEYVGTNIIPSSEEQKKRGLQVEPLEDCECGAKIRYVNHVRNTITEETAQLGNDHLKCVLPDKITSEIIKGNKMVRSNHARMMRHEVPRRIPPRAIDSMEEKEIITEEEAIVLRRQPVDIRKLIEDGSAEANAIVDIHVKLANRLDLEMQEINNMKFFQINYIDPISCLFCLTVFERDDASQRICDACVLEIEREEKREYTTNFRVSQAQISEMALVGEKIAEGIIYSRNKVLSDPSTRVDRTFCSTILENSTETQDFNKAMDEWKCNGPMRIAPGTRSASGTLISNVHEIVNLTTGIVLPVKKRRIELCKYILPFRRCQICLRRAINPDMIDCNRCRFLPRQ